MIEQPDEMVQSEPVSGPDMEDEVLSNGSLPETPRPLRLPVEESDDEKVPRANAAEIQLFSQTGLGRSQVADSDHATGPDTSVIPFIPAVLYPVLNAVETKTPWPLVARDSAAGLKIAPFRSWIEELATSEETDGDERALRVQMLRHLAGELIDAAAGPNPASIADLLLPRGEPLLATFKKREDREAALKAAFERIQSVLGENPTLFPFSVESVRSLMTRVAQTDQRRTADSFLAEITWLAGRLEEMLQVEAEDSKAGHSPERLAHTMGGAYSDSIDFSSLSHLIDEAPHGARLDPERRDRIESVLAILGSVRDTLFTPDDISVSRSPRKIISTLEKRLEQFIQLARSLQIARLEVANRYRADVHDLLFERYGWDSIDPSEARYFPAVLAHIHVTDRSVDWTSLLSALNGPGRLVLLVTFERAYDDSGFLTPEADLARNAISRGVFFVQQSCMSNAAYVAEGMKTGICSTGSALLSVFTGSVETHGALDPFLRSSVAGDTRVVPSFRFDPGAGSEWVDRFSAGANESPSEICPDQEWPVEAGGETEIQRFSVSPAVFMCSDSRFQGEFLRIPNTDQVHAHALEERFANLDDKARDKAVFIWLSTFDGEMHRFVVSPKIIRGVTEALHRWRLIQEWSGVRSSLIEKSLDAAEKQIRKRADADIARAKEEYAQKLDEATGSLAGQIVTNIASGLLGLHGSSPSLHASVTDHAAASPLETSREVSGHPETPDHTETADPDDDPEEAPLVSMDEAYIDTPLCTSCNECTNLNGLIFAYNGDKQAYIKDASAGPFRDLVKAAEVCPVLIIHPGKPLDPDEEGLDELIERARPFN